MENEIILPKEKEENTDIIPIPSPPNRVDPLEEALTKFMVKAYEESSQKDFDFEDYLQIKLREAIESGEISGPQLMTLYLNHQTSRNDRLSRLITPFANIAAKKAELASLEAIKELELKHSIDSEDFKSANEKAPSKNILQGLSTLNQLLGEFASNQKEEEEK